MYYIEFKLPSAFILCIMSFTRDGLTRITHKYALHGLITNYNAF